jgi:SAM-dependent methyltransferase
MKHVNNYLRKILYKLHEMRNSFRSPETIFKEVYRKGHWTNDETRSGSGSTLLQTRNLIQVLPSLLEQYSIKTVLDIPCGDFNWMKEVNLSGIDYSGADIVDELVEENIRKYQQMSISFFKADILEDTLPKVDLILCRDCLVHFSNKHVWQAIENIYRSGSRFLLTTTFPGRSRNRSITTGSWRPINFQISPFNFPEPMAVYVEGNKETKGDYADKALALWEINKLPGHNVSK